LPEIDTKQTLFDYYQFEKDMKTKFAFYLAALLFFTVEMHAQITVSGTVKDEKGIKLSGVNVLIKGTNTGTVTNHDGFFSVVVKDLNATLLFTKKGLQALEYKLNQEKTIQVVMKPAIQIVDTLVVVDNKREIQNEYPMFGNVRNLSGVNSGSYSRDFIVEDYNTEEYDLISENSFKNAKDNPVSTFSIDVDKASYSNIRRFLNSGQKPIKDAVRIEEMINYFDYDYPDPQGEHPFSIYTEYSDCPWNKSNRLLHIGIQGKRLDYNDFKPSNFVFLIDVSGSMSPQNKLPLLKQSFIKLLDTLGRNDKVSIVVYAGAAGLVLPPTPAYQKEKIKAAIENLKSGGSTAGGAGIQLAYKTAEEGFIQDGNNRVILATDGDFNVGVSSTSELVRIIEEKRKTGIYLTILGFGMGNYKDGRMEQISNAGNGNYFYIDGIKEADKVFGREMRANLFTIAKDVKIQIEFNPMNVKSYRLVGYENRLLNKEDFEDDKKDAGELGPGHTVTAIYEITPNDSTDVSQESDDLKYQSDRVLSGNTNELMTLKFRYKLPEGDKSILIEQIVNNEPISIQKSSEAFRFSAAVAIFGMLLRDSEYKGISDYGMVMELAKNAFGKDPYGEKKEFLELLRKAKEISGIL
jgi:Ca-activated chloride channel family protein